MYRILLPLKWVCKLLNLRSTWGTLGKLFIYWDRRGDTLEFNWDDKKVLYL